MSDAPIDLSESRSGSIVEQRRAPAPPKDRVRAAFWRMVGMVRPHRRAMIAGVLLGFGVALTYATSLVGILPVLKIVVEQENLHAYFNAHAETVRGNPNWPGWAAALYAAALRGLGGIFPPPTSPNAPMRSLLLIMALLVGLNIAGNVLRVFSQYLVLLATHRTMMDVRRKLYRKALHVPMSAVSGDLSNTVSQFMSDTREVFIGITTLFGKVAREPLKAVCVLAVAISLDWRVTAVALAIAPPAVLLLWFFGRKIRKAMGRLLQGYGEMLGGLEETLQGIATVKSYAREGLERRRMWQLERRMLTQQLKLAWIEAISSPLIEVVGLLAAAAGIVWLAGRTFSAEMTTSQFGTMVILLVAMLDPVRKVANVYNMVQRSGAASERLFRFLDQPEERVAERPRRLPGAPRDGQAPVSTMLERDEPEAVPVLPAYPVIFEAVTYRYAPASPPALDEVSFEARAGECLAVVGPNGSGKSTLLRLLPRLLELQEGRITLGGVDVRELSLKTLREQVAIVDQRPAIFARSVADNIAYGKPDATRAEISAAAARAFAADFIERLPQGFDTVLGEFGSTLSGGQRQRLAIARAFLKPASILIFDEATSEVDAESERKIHAALAELRRGKTTFLIAHRHTVMDMADRVVVLDGGRLVDIGLRAELLARCPLFVALYQSPTPH